MESDWRMNVWKLAMTNLIWLGQSFQPTLAGIQQHSDQVVRVKMNRGGPNFRLDCVWSGLDQLYQPSGNFSLVGPNERFPYGMPVRPDHPI